MFRNRLIKGYDKHRLRGLLALFFLALAVPTTILIWQAYSQLKWEAFDQYRSLAVELTTRVDARLIDMIHTADSRSFADYTFLVVAGDPSANFVQRSPLSAYPVAPDLPGVLGYFQVDTRGSFSSPILPSAGREPEEFGINDDEYQGRLQLTKSIQAILADNRLVRSRADSGLLRDVARTQATSESEFKDMAQTSPAGRTTTPVTQIEELRGSGIVNSLIGYQTNSEEAVNRPESLSLRQGAMTTDSYSQQVFDQLNQPGSNKPLASDIVAALQKNDTLSEKVELRQGFKSIGKVSSLDLDVALQKKSATLERDNHAATRKIEPRVSQARSKRREQISLPEEIMLDDELPLASTADAAAIRISTFESEIDPMELSLLDSGHFVLFRKVWRDGERYIQGLLFDPNILITEVIETGFRQTALSEMSNLIVAYQDDVIRTLSGRDDAGYPVSEQMPEGSLLYQTRLSAPLNSLELIFSINRLPAGPGATVLSWVTLVLASVFLVGFYLLYRLGASQIDLARQQQDFVSAVSHELKTPLTSIRMYGEILKEGWVDEEKRKTYYQYIHDESERLSRLISNILQLASITRNEPQLELKSVTVGELMSDIESKISHQAENAGFMLRFIRDAATDQAVVRIDQDCFAQIIINLVDNAIKFARQAENKTIEITSSLTGNKQVRFSVRDFGPGIPKARLKKVFELFYRLESELTRETAGTGIGLAIVHQLTVAMNGKVDVVRQEPGVEFQMMFPMTEAI